MTAGRRLALLVSTSLYDSPAFRQLQSPAADVVALRAILEDPVIGGYEVILLQDKVSYEVNQSIEGFFSRTTLDDLALLYFSGHGYKDDGNRLFMVTRDSQPNLLGSTATSAQFVRDQLERCRSRRKVVILDCCYAGAFPLGATKDAGNVDVLGGFGGRGSVVMTATSALQYAFEKNIEAAASEIRGLASPSIFTSALIEGITTGKADLNGDGVIDVDELYKYVHKQVTRKVPQQTPRKHSDIEGTFGIVRSPRGPKPIRLPREFTQNLRSPLTKVRLGVIEHLVEYCSEAPLGMVMAIRNALSELTDDDSNMVAKAARAAISQVEQHAALLAAIADNEAEAMFVGNEWQSRQTLSYHSEGQSKNAGDHLLTAAQREAETIQVTARREVEELMSITEREVAQLKTAAKRERDEIVTTSKRQAEEIRGRAQRVLEESEAQRAKAEAEFETQLTMRRQKAEQQEAEQLVASRSAAQELIRNAEKDADQIVSQAKAQAEQMLIEAESRRAAAQREIDELTSQKDSIASRRVHVFQVPDGQMPRSDAAALQAETGLNSPAQAPARSGRRSLFRKRSDEEKRAAFDRGLPFASAHPRGHPWTADGRRNCGSLEAVLWRQWDPASPPPNEVVVAVDRLADLPVRIKETLVVGLDAIFIGPGGVPELDDMAALRGVPLPGGKATWDTAAGAYGERKIVVGSLPSLTPTPDVTCRQVGHALNDLDGSSGRWQSDSAEFRILYEVCQPNFASDHYRISSSSGRREFFADAFAAIVSRQRPALVEILSGNTRTALQVMLYFNRLYSI